MGGGIKYADRQIRVMRISTECAKPQKHLFTSLIYFVNIHLSSEDVKGDKFVKQRSSLQLTILYLILNLRYIYFGR